jgi:hypothetical protein
MPRYVPDEDELNAVRDAVYPEGGGGYNPHHPFDPNRLPQFKLIKDLNNVVATAAPDQGGGVWPAGINGINLAAIPPALNQQGNERSRALAIALAILRPQWQAAQALEEFRSMRRRLLAAWNTWHNAEEKMRKVLDEVVVFGNLAPPPGWSLAHEVAFRAVLEGCMYVAHHIMGPPDGPGLIPALNLAWGHPFSDDVSIHAAIILSWLQVPYPPAPEVQAGGSIRFEIVPEGCAYQIPGQGLKVVPPGSRRSFLLVRPSARLQSADGGTVHAAQVVRRVILRSLDDGKTEIQLAELAAHDKGVNVAGPTLKLDVQTPAGQLLCDEPSELQEWSCPCGRWSCDKEHRLSAWDPSKYPPDASFNTFLLTAVKGKAAKGKSAGAFEVGKFIEGMYYALLREGT